MGEMMWCDVDVVLPTSWGNDEHPPRVIEGIGGALCGGYREANDLGDGRTHWVLQGEGNYGLGGLSDALRALEELHVPYVAADDGKYEVPGTRRVFNGQTVAEFNGNTSGAWIDLLTVQRLGSYQAVLAHLTAGNRHVSEFSIDHLPATEPTDDERDNEEEG